MKLYRAPWSRPLVIISCAASFVCIGEAIAIFAQTHGLARWSALVPLCVVLGSVLFTIRGYSVTSDAILVERLFWTTRLPLAGLQSAQFEPEAMRKSSRTFGNGGLFSFSGFFYNKALGAYRAFVTDPRQTVVLRFPKRTVVLSPAAPQEFVHEFAISSRAV